ncbi:bifunctional DNA-formamidopyrimidine glycosylase/DNA-(apurinic or apyrimidinic site) lyase [Methylococcus capsulatus]|uniref:bifunctional DNA-formamidopyrimidine glycosylase/DNA-(apurinic or apyrimidinic site) lyase n=1 Tax=Methylococcus capsulatus TaxID=414 RepID=UPI001C53090A|nr:bifunctional DNA-formamidopyrimidine glycosylase/DNA-(apurinic or apyrimidinic site) lyase [Methylococcus capsulatus]QXP86526.1 bifunctional DNA-formamidopyrimidine glycosylase/DNA-(apurinic or apyrimidinic site) lyase [Methylococcus capsulatus]QXP93804.1 bifunctional DNA-formamidopyrimidine glycosylase/DNA-(apurinic or apyrimidinic site) lyase [Methylococcus capsulatus]UQN11474.1 bifunctional DNA-formamidopyrimidine glycosylase/DNA-(apurinic or apyrimidinic site) lyase [Methylococcus capsula
MPELPEVETTRRGIAPHIAGRRIVDVRVREARLRWPVPADLGETLTGRRLTDVRRRGKYLLLDFDEGTLIAHLGMSGSLRICKPGFPPRKHDHVDLVFEGDICLRYHDPRRFGCLLWTAEPPERHPLLAALGPEPLDKAFDGAHLHRLAAGRNTAVKSFIMDSRVVAGVGNIYANEALFRAGIHPARPAGKISLARYRNLGEHIAEVLAASIEQGGTTLRDFVNESGAPGYFKQVLRVYDRAGQPCRVCGEPIRCMRLGQRATYYCPRCQR